MADNGVYIISSLSFIQLIDIDYCERNTTSSYLTNKIMSLDKEQIENLKGRVQLSISMREKLLEREDLEVERITSFANTLMGSLGIIAGFGFTAFQYIQILDCFLLGETLIIGAIFYLGFKVKYHLVGTATATSNLIYDYQDDAAKIKKAILENDHDTMIKCGKEFIDSVNNVDIKVRVIRAKAINTILNITFVLASLGLVLILSSFIFCF